MVNLMEVVLPPMPPRGVTAVGGLLMVNGYEVGGRMMVVAVGLGTFAPPLSGVTFVGGLEVVRMVTLFMFMTCWAVPVVPFGTVNKGRVLA